MMEATAAAPRWRNRIVEHVRVQAKELVPHPMNYRQHPDEQRDALEAIYEEVGIARSLLGYKNAQGRIVLIDGHLRRDLDPEATVVVEILDVSEDEAKKLLLTIDPLVGLAQVDKEAHARLAALVRTRSPDLGLLWNESKKAAVRLERLKKRHQQRKAEREAIPEQFLLVITCDNEHEQTDLYQEFKSRGLEVAAKVG